MGVILLCTLFCNVSAQQAINPDAQFVAPKKTTANAVKKRGVQKAGVQGPVEIGGMLVKAVQAQKPWEVFSPFAPISAGSGEDMTEEDPDELGKPQGFILFGIQW